MCVKHTFFPCKYLSISSKVTKFLLLKNKRATAKTQRREELFLPKHKKSFLFFFFFYKEEDTCIGIYKWVEFYQPMKTQAQQKEERKLSKA